MCHGFYQQCMKACTPDCPYYCLDAVKGGKVGDDLCPNCDLGVEPGDCTSFENCNGDQTCPLPGYTCHIPLNLCMTECANPERCEWQCVNATDNKLGTDLCSPCNVENALRR